MPSTGWLSLLLNNRAFVVDAALQPPGCMHQRLLPQRLWTLAPPTLQCLRPSLRAGPQECGCSSHQQLGYDARGLQGAVCERMIHKRQAELAAGALPTITAADRTRLLGALPAPACNCCKRVLCGRQCMPNTTFA
jgi:hypothetical protein